jgi:nitrite reductase/ring-hydroxylating ferredoxin subunit
MSWLAEHLGALIKERGVSVDAVARQLAIERSYLNRVLDGSRTPNEILTRRMATFFEESADDWVANSQEALVATKPPSLPELQEGWTKVANVSDVPPGELLICQDGLAVIANVGGDFYSFANFCPHAGGAIGEGFLEEEVVECPWHAGRWNVVTGEALTILATNDIPTWPVRVNGDDIELDWVPGKPGVQRPNYMGDD